MDTRLIQLMQRYITGQVSETEKRKVEAWLDLKKTEEGNELTLSPDDEQRLFDKITGNLTREDVGAFRPSRTNTGTRIWRAAAAAAVLIMASWVLWLFIGRTDAQRFGTVASNKAILHDGSIVWMTQNSRLIFDERHSVRRASFSGEGMFEVAHDPERPFTISCGDVSVRVIGTSFTLRSVADTFELKVLTGKVKVYTSRDTTGTLVTRWESATYTPLAGIRKSELMEEEVSSLIADTEYDMVFENTSMEDVLARIEQKFDVTVTVENQRIMRCRITADFTDHSLSSTLSMLSELLEMQYDIDDRSISISGNGC